MIDIYNTLSAVFALIILFVTNRNVFFSKDTTKHALKEYKLFVISIALFQVADICWSVTRQVHGTPYLLYIESVAYNITMIFTVCMCCRYVSKFLELQNKKGKFLDIFGIGFFAGDIILVIINFFTPILFWVDDNSIYHTAIGRDIGMYFLVAVFVVMAMTALYDIKNSQGFTRQKVTTIFYFTVFITLTLLCQAIFPDYPCYSMGMAIGIVIIFVHIHVAEQADQLEKIQELNNHLEESQKLLEEGSRELEKQKQMLEASNIGTWELIFKDGCRTRLRTDAKMKDLMALSTDSDITDEDACDMLLSRINPDDYDMFMEYSEKLRQGKRDECTYRWDNPVLGERYIRCGGAFVSCHDGESISNGYHYDITEIKNLENDLKLSLASGEMKTKLLQNMSHEIRTPLNAMFGFAQLLGMPDGTWSDEDKDRYNKIIYNTFNMLDMLVNDILDTADVQHGNFRMQMSEFEVNDMCRTTLMSVEFRRPGNVEMKFITDLDDNHTITSDSRRIQQILINFLTNACKNTAKGDIRLSVTNKEKPGMLVFSVSDTGKGVPEDKADLIFGRYTKLDQKVQGSGLGLNICDTIANKLNAKIYLDTSYTDGACFKLEVEDKVLKEE